MAKKKTAAAGVEKEKGQNGVFIFSGIFLAVGAALFMFVLYNSFTRTTNTYNKTIASITTVASINDEILKINRNVLMMVARVDGNNAENQSLDIERGFTNIRSKCAEYEKLEHSELEMYRYNQAKMYIEQYEAAIQPLSEAAQTSSASTQSLSSIYVSAVHPLQIAATEMVSATTNIAELDTQDRIQRVAVAFQTAELIILIVAVLGEAGIVLAAIISKRNREALAKQAAEIEAANQKFQRTKAKATEMAYINILTDMKNRYALDQDISPRLESDQFNIAVFDLDNFRSINDMYGYDFGDEYLATVAERLKQEYGSDAEIYNITGNEFCFVFNRDVSDMQANRIAEKVIQTLGDWYTIYNLNVQTTASGSTCHYLPGDCLNTSSLLVKLDNVLREAKRNGGNMVLQVVGI